MSFVSKLSFSDRGVVYESDRYVKLTNIKNVKDTCYLLGKLSCLGFQVCLVV